MDAQKHWALIVRYDGENRRLPLEKMNTGMNIQFLPPLAVPSGLKAAPKTPAREKTCVPGTGCAILIKLMISGYAGPARETEL